VVYPGRRQLSRREIDELTDFVKHYGAKGLVWIGVAGARTQRAYYRRCAAQPGHKVPQRRSSCTHASSPPAAQVVGDLILIVADKPGSGGQSLSNLRLEIGKRANLIDPNLLAYCWVVDFPLLEYNEDDKRWQAVHHPFTSARDEDWDKAGERPRQRAGQSL
jgi:aspartyl-tRNA synthetase